MKRSASLRIIHAASGGSDGSRPVRRLTTAALSLLVVTLVGVTLSSPASAAKCELPDDGGTVGLPPAGCEYLSPHEVFLIIDGLPPDTTIELKPILNDFVCSVGPQPSCSQAIPPGLCEAPGGGLGGNVSCSDSTLHLEVKGTGLLAGFSRTLTLPVGTEAHSGPRTPGAPVQAFDTELVSLQSDIFGDPDFDFLQIRAGSAFGLPSPGHTTLRQLTNGNWNVDSFFDITYSISFQGSPGSILEGLAGTTQASLRMATNVNPCDVVDNGTGTIDLPPAGCQYISLVEPHRILDGLPPGTTLELDAIYEHFICGNPLGTCSLSMPPGVCEGPGGSLGGTASCFASDASLTITGTGTLAGFSRSIVIPLDTEVHSGPRNPGDPIQSFFSRMIRLQGEIFGDPDFCILRLRAGDQLGLPSPGHTVLTDRGDGIFSVDSFFDVTYEIDFTGCPGSALEGYGGTTLGTVRMQTGAPVVPTSAPGVSGVWLWVLGGVLVALSIWTIRRLEMAR